MIVACPSCQARFRYDDERFQGLPRKRFRCPKCSAVFEVENPALQSPPTPAPMPPTEALPEPPSTSAPPQVPAPVDAPTPFPEPNPQDTTVHSVFEDTHTALGATGLGIPPGYRFSLAFLNGPRASTVATLQSPHTVIGREEGDIITQDPECSRRHARIDIRADGTAWLVDLGSTNGTFVEGVRVVSAIQLTDRQEFTCGRSSFMMIIRREDPNMVV